MNSVINEKFWENGPAPGSLYNFPGQSTAANMPVKHTMQPMVTGTSVIGVKFDGGVIIAADDLGSYGSMARYRNIKRVEKVNEKTVIGAGGDYADFQFLSSILEEMVQAEIYRDEGMDYNASAVHSWLERVLYNRRSRFNPLWNTVLVGGFDRKNEPFLGYVNMIGTSFTGNYAASGFAAHLAVPALRKWCESDADKTQDAALAVVKKCMLIQNLRDARSWHKYTYAVITKDGVSIENANIQDEGNDIWKLAHFVKGYN